MSIDDCETWRPVLGYEGSYEVSDHGRVRSIDRYVPHGRSRAFQRGRDLTLGRSTRGYVTVHLRPARSNKSVHRLVLEAFVGPAPDGMVCCHNDGNQVNNHISNLRWDTLAANSRDAVHHGAIGGKSHCRNGHPYSEYHYDLPSAPGYQACRACRDVNIRARNERRKAARRQVNA